MNNILGYSDGRNENEDMDLEYFRTMIESKIHQIENESGYMEQLAMKEMSGGFDAEEEF